MFQCSDMFPFFAIYFVPVSLSAQSGHLGLRAETCRQFFFFDPWKP